MSELNDYRITTRSGNVCHCYLKSEADKVIAEKDKKIDLYKRGFKEDDKIIAYLYAELRHYKYKRCLAMAKWCRFWENYWSCCKPNDIGAFIARERFFRKWKKRWMKIAKNFKERKNAED